MVTVYSRFKDLDHRLSLARTRAAVAITDKGRASSEKSVLDLTEKWERARDELLASPSPRKGNIAQMRAEAGHRWVIYRRSDGQFMGVKAHGEHARTVANKLASDRGWSGGRSYAELPDGVIVVPIYV